MVRRLQNGQPWPQAKSHGEMNGSSDNSEWPALRTAHRQLGSSIDLEKGLNLHKSLLSVNDALISADFVKYPIWRDRDL